LTSLAYVGILLSNMNVHTDYWHCAKNSETIQPIDYELYMPMPGKCNLKEIWTHTTAGTMRLVANYLNDVGYFLYKLTFHWTPLSSLLHS
jgi:hypothetical protein